MINNVRGRPEAAAQWFEQIREKFGQDRAGEVANDFGDVIQYVETQLGIMALDRDDYDQADRHFQNAKSQARRQNNPERLARSYLSLGTVSFFRSDFSAAREYFVQGNVVAEYIQHGELLAWFAWNKGAVHVIEGNYKRAGWLLRDALHKANDFGIRNALPNIFVWLGLMHLCQSQTGRARAYFLQVLNQPSLPRTRIAAYALYGLALTSRYEHDLTISADSETAHREVNEALADAGLNASLFSAVTPADIEGAHAYFKIALIEIPELERFHIKEGLIGWLMSDTQRAGLVRD
jgi:tetratricopeptide (TPR) repeat protein